MNFHDLPVVFLSYREGNALSNLEHLRGMVPSALHVSGVKGFDAAHREAARVAKEYATKAGIDTQMHPYFITIDADNKVRPDFWQLDTDHMVRALYHRDNRPAPGSSVLSWNAYNPVTGLAYGNGGVKLWGYDFITNMVTHEKAQTTTVDFCWTPGYVQLSKVFSITEPGSEEQAFTAGFREGVKMTLVGGQADLESLYEVQHRAYPTNMERLIAWCSLGAHHEFGVYSMYGAVLGFVECHIKHVFELKDVSNIDLIYERFASVRRNVDIEARNSLEDLIWDDLPLLRKQVQRLTNVKIPSFGPLQSQYVVNRTRPAIHSNPFEMETWPPKLDPNV